MKKIYLTVAGLFLGVYGIITIFENAYFSAPFFGVQAPGFTDWVGSLPLWSFDLTDFLALIGVVVLAYGATRKEKKKKRRTRK